MFIIFFEERKIRLLYILSEFSHYINQLISQKVKINYYQQMLEPKENLDYLEMGLKSF